MPTYEYKCSKCEHKQDHRMKMDDPKPNCPRCDAKEEYSKQITSAQFMLKGNGWYQTDFKNKR